MKSSPRFLALALSCLANFTESSALELRSYDSSVHDRFVNFPENPTFNPSFVLEAEKHNGVGWGSESTHKQFALISRCHVLFAAHHAPAIGSRISFLSSTGSIVERSVTSRQAIKNPTSSTSDVLLITLSAPIGNDEGIEPLPYLNLESEEDYFNLPLVVLGSHAKAGEGKLVDFRTINVNWIVSRTFRFDYVSSEGDSDDARLAGGDSGSPSLVDVDGVSALLGIHLATSSSGGVQSNFDAFIPHYVKQIDPIIATAGFRMRPLNAAPSELVCPSPIVSPNAAQGQALDLEFALKNAGANPTGNLELQLRFPDGTEPDHLEADGWIVTGDGSQWTLRRALLEEGASAEIRAHWSAAPLVGAIEPELRWVSDATPEGSMELSVPLAAGFSSWASSLEEAGELDDPDRDGLPNLIEYAFGSNPRGGSTAATPITPPAPSFTVQNGIATYRHPERTDKVERGLNYTPEWSRTLKVGQWSHSPPNGFSSTTSPYFPEIPGFTERIITWPLQESHRFIRLDITE